MAWQGQHGALCLGCCTEKSVFNMGIEVFHKMSKNKHKAEGHSLAAGLQWGLHVSSQLLRKLHYYLP